ncbi:MAG: hypothetical protein K6G92_04360 [Bacteroidaceae bacterium]|nr:hypothetical protein [Bacteroidaceae bacterium]
MATYAITLNERTASGKALKAYLQALGVFVSKVTPKATPETRIYDPETGCYLKDSVVKSIEQAHEDMKHGRLKAYNSVEDMFKDLGINV